MNACCEALLLKWRALKSVVEFSCGAAAALFVLFCVLAVVVAAGSAEETEASSA